VLRPRLLGVPGVARVADFGGDVREFQIQLEPAKLAQYALSIDEVLAAAKNSTGLRGAGFVETANQRVILQSLGQSLSPAQIGNAIVRRHGGATVRLHAIAHVDTAAAPAIGGASVNTQPGVLVEVSSQYP